VLRHIENGIDGLLLGGVDEGASVDNKHIGVFGIPGQFVARFLREPEHDF